jgi:hypothetical protein
MGQSRFGAPLAHRRAVVGTTSMESEPEASPDP